MSHLFLLCLVVKSKDHHILYTLCIISVAWAIAPAILFLPHPADVSSDYVIVLFESNG